MLRKWLHCGRWMLAGLLIGSILAAGLRAQDIGEESLADDEVRQVQVAERFLSVLEENPRRGTALDRVYGHHVEFGTLDDFLQNLWAKVTQSPDDGTAWMLLGLFEAHRGEDAAAIDAFRNAEERRAEDALASYYLGQSLLLVGQPDEAVAAFERAIERNPPRADLLEIFQQLGRVHQRAQRNDAAMAVWQRLESLFPDDPRVQEQIAVTLVEEGQYALALPRYEQLAKLVRDDYRRVVFQIEAAELKIRENRRDDGLQDLENILANLNPDGWLHRDVRRRIEEVFLRTGDQDGLVKYYERWTERHPEDVDSMARLAKFLASSARIPEATQWMEKALKLAPKRVELRRAFIDQLVDEQRYAEAAAQYAELAKSAPANSDFLRDWGKLVLRDKSQDVEKRKVEATRIWREIIATRPEDAATIAQVADLFRQANINEEAIALYQKAIELAPEEPQYREYLGEFYHVLKRPEEALATWRTIAEGPRRTAVNVARLAEVYNSFGYMEQATAEIAAACQLDPKDFSLQLTAAEYHTRGEKFDEALAHVDAAEKMVANDDERESVIKARIEALQSSRRLEEEIERMAARLAGDPAASAADWHIMARYYEADRRWNDATEAIEQALAKDSKSIPAIETAARIAELAGDFARAADMSRQLAAVDRRSRSDHLMNVARLESQMGRTDAALQAGKDLIASAPGNTDNYEFFAQLCFRLGKPDDGLDALRKAVRINPTEPHLTTALGSALAEQFRTDEAIEVYWRAFERTEEIDDKTSLTMKLAELYLQTNQFDKLVERLERERQEDEKRREMTICLAQAHHTSGDYGTARHEMESLLDQESQDTVLLQQLSKLCEQGSDLDAAIDYQRRLVEIAPGAETEFRLAGLLQSRGDREEASEILVKLTRREEDPARLLRSIDSLLTQGSYESVLAITEPLLSQQRDDWELLYREVVAWASLEKPQEAKDRCQRMLALALPHETLGVAAEAKFKQAQSKARSDNLRGLVSQMPQRQSPLSMLGMSSQVRQAAGLDTERFYSGMGPQRVWTPESFGVARMAAYGWLLKFEGDERQSVDEESANEKVNESFVDPLAKAAAAEGADRETLYDWMYVEQLRGNYESIFKISKQLAKGGGKEEQRFFLSSLRLRNVNAQRQLTSRNQLAKKDPLSDEDLELMLRCYESLADDDKSQEASTAAYGGQIAYSSTGQMYVNVGGNWIQVSGNYSGNMFLGTILEDLKLAGREEKANELLDAVVARAKKAQELANAMNLLLAEEKFDQLPQLYARWTEAAKTALAEGPAPTGRQTARQQAPSPLASNANCLIQWMGKLGPDEEHAQILSILDPALDLAIEEAKKRRSARPARSSSLQSQPQYYNTRYSLMYGKERINANVEYPRPNQYVDQSALTLLREAFEVFTRNDVVSDLPDHLRKRLEKSSADNRVYEELMLGYVLWWTEEQEEAVQLLTTAAQRLQDDPSFRLEMATLHETLGDVDRALEIVESIAPRDQKLVQQRESMALQLAERLGDIGRARKAAERLFGLRLDNDSQLALVERMRRLGLHEMAEAVVSRVQRRTGNQPSSLATLMAMYRGQGKVELAEQIAHTLLRRTTSPMTTMAMAGRVSRGYSRTPTDASRSQALQLLHQTGALKELTQRLETQLEQSPDSPRLYEQLIEYYQAAGTRDKVQALLEKAIAQRPDAPALRMQLAQELQQSGKLKEACDQYLELLRQKPALLMDDFYSIRNVFDRAQRRLDLVKALETINLKSLGQPYYIIDLVSELLQERSGQASEENTEIALKLFERVFEAFPSYRNQLVSRLYNQELWKNERVYALGKRGIIPSADEVAAQPWFGIDSIYSYSSGGTVNAMFHQMLNGVRGTDKLADLRKTVEAALAENPGWHGGQTMLALIDLKENKKTEAKERLEKLVASDEVLKSMPSDACWIVGQELDQFEDTRPLALRLFETAVSSDQRNQSQLQYSPVSRLVKLYGSLNRKQDARELLLKQLRSSPGDQYDAQYAAYMRVENSVWAGNQFLELGYSVDAVRMFRDLIDGGDSLQQAGMWYGGRPEQFAAQAQNGLKKAMASIQEVDAKEAIEQLIAPPEDIGPGQPVLDLMLSVPDAKSVRSQEIESSLTKLLKSLSQNATVTSEIDARLSSLAGEHPQDFSVPVAQALHRLQSADDRAAETLEHLATMVTAAPLDEIPTGRRPNSRQRREALLRVPLWLVAREYLAKPEAKEQAAKLATEAVEAARRQVDNKFFVAILYDWGQRAVEAGDRGTAEAKWSELLEAVTKRPERREQPAQRRQPGPPAPAPAPGPAARPPAVGRVGRQVETLTYALELLNLHRVSWLALLAQPAAAAAAPATAGQPAAPNVAPPLTISQFRVAIEVAVAAAENGMPQLSQHAVEKAMSGGVPVPDPDRRTVNRQAGLAFATAVRVRQPSVPEGSSAIEIEVAGALRKVLDRWQGDAYAPAQVYELLHPIVMPTSRPADILLYGDSSKLRDARVESLGATLVNWAHRAEKLPDLSQRVAERKQNAQSLVAALVMQTLIEMAAGEIERAGTSLKALSENVQQRALPQMVQLACHAAIPAADVPELRDDAFKILEIAVRQDTQSSATQDEATLGALVDRVNKHLADEPQKVKEFYEAFLVGRQQQYARYGGDYGLYLQWRDWAGVADAAAKAGVPTVALDFMGRVADFQYQNNPRPSLTASLASVCRVLRGQSSQQRYEAWRDWTMPTEGRQTVRVLAEWIDPTTVPSAFLPADKSPAEGRAENLVCNLHELLEAAAASGTFDTLREQARTAWEQKLPGADVLWALVLIHAKEREAAQPVIAEMIKSLPERAKRVQNQPRPDLWGDYLVYRACMQSPEFASLYEEHRIALRDAFRSDSQANMLVQMDYDYMVRAAIDRGASIRPGDPEALLHWLAVSPRDLTSSAKASWLVHEGQVVHLPGPGIDTLQMAYPVTGDFQFSVDCFQGRWAESEAGYGGILVDTASQVVVTPLSSHETIRRPPAYRRSGFNRIDIRVAGGKMKFFVNNHLAYEEDASPTSPWLMLYTHAPRTTVFRNPVLTGNPVIPREVSLVSGNRLDGWNATFFGESQPRQRFMAEKPQSENDYVSYEQQREPAEHDWRAEDGVLLGAPKSDLAGFTQSWIYYHRPLCEDETFQYEFYYTPGASAAYPTFGRLAFLLEPGGVELHWIARSGWDDSVLGIPLDNRVTEAECRRGPPELPLRPNNWNKVALTMRGDRIVVALNGVEVYERPLEPENHRLVGLFRDKRRAAKVRSAVLTGPWPGKFTPELQRELIAVGAQHPDADRRLVGELLTDVFAEHDVTSVATKAASLSDDERLALLERWVLPSPDHSSTRLYYQHEPLNSSRVEKDSASSLHGGMVCPAVDLIDTAGRLNKLPKLIAKIKELGTGSVTQRRGKFSLLAIAAIRSGDDEAAKESLAALYKTVRKNVPKNAPLRERAPEYVAAWMAAERPALRFSAHDFSRRLRSMERGKATSSGNTEWRRDIYALVARTESALARSGGEEPQSSDKVLTQWTSVPQRNVSLQHRGRAPSQWHLTRGLAEHLPGKSATRLFFQSPLRGKFEIFAEQSVSRHREVAVSYGGHAAMPRHDLKAKRVTTLPRNTKNTAVELSIPNWEWIASFRIAVDGTKVSTFVNGVPIHEEFVTPQPNPWIVLQALPGGNDCTVQNVRIEGSPEIPDELDLIDAMSPAFWEADLYGESLSIDGPNENAVWLRTGEEIVGQLRKDRSADPLESLLAYQRPVLEDGTIEFEQYFVPNEFEVHPAVGRHALIVRPEGVTLHRLTNGSWEASDLTPDNESAIEGAASSVPLRENDWNHFKLELRTDLLTLTVNGVKVAELTLDGPAAERFFGLFRYANKSQCRVRKLVYRGAWPKQLPDLTRQELAFTSNEQGNESPVLVSTAADIPLQGSAEVLEQHGIALKNEGGITPSDSGVTIQVDEPSSADDPTGLVIARRIQGDCDVTLDFDQLQIAASENGADAGFALRIVFDSTDSADDLCAEVAIVAGDEGRQSLSAMVSHRALDASLQQETRRIGGQWQAGRFRIVRRGGQVQCLFAEKDADTFRLLGSFPIGHAPISALHILAHGTGKSSDNKEPIVLATARKLEVRTPRSSDAAIRSTTK